MKYFITGGAGFIGSHMVDRLLQDSNSFVTIYDNLCSGQTAFIKKHLQSRRAVLIKGDMLDFEELKEKIIKHDVVFHFAANPDIAKSMIETDLDLKQTILSTYNLLEAMRLNAIKTIIFSSGSGIYGDVGLTETPEDFGPLMPISMYGASKLGAEGIISAFCHMFDMQSFIFRFANVVGKRQTHGVGYDFIKKLKVNPDELEILGDGTQSKSYIHVTDIIEAILFVYHNSHGKVNFFNVATDDYIDVTRIAQIVIQEMGLKNVRCNYTGGDRGWKGDVPKVRFCLRKIHQLGWKAKHNSTEAVKKSIREMLGKE